eukprot:TRINITY_DN2794_c0_g1_i2.p1 TRINITY_DN2794_c0_g1~~TRINITY_DN2794_c0_g1_i2.p1  ORF type:complete len:186 (-),score=49.82 TRINITY_DN2794_c0_g1_i2:155-712(-)
MGRISGGGEVCQGEDTEIRFDMEGTGPWLVEFTNGQLNYSLTLQDKTHRFRIETSRWHYATPHPEVVRRCEELTGSYSITRVSDAHCEGVVSGSAQVTIHPLPTARIEGGGLICEGEEMRFEITLTGTPSWTLELLKAESTNAPLSVTTDRPIINVTTSESGHYFVHHIHDRYCSYTRTKQPRFE